MDRLRGVHTRHPQGRPPGSALWIALLLLAVFPSCGHRRARESLKRGQWDAVLTSLTSTDAFAYRLRAKAWIGKGNPQQAYAELAISLALDSDSAETRGLMAQVERQLGNTGGELAQLESVSRITEDQPPEDRRRLAELLRQRAHLCATPQLGLACKHQIEQDLLRAQKLDPSSHPSNTWAPNTSAARAGDQTSTTPYCPGVLPERRPLRIPRTADCGLRQAQINALLAGMVRRHIRMACEGVQIARHLEEHGCLIDATRVWQRLARETPGNPRWPFEKARVQLALDELRKAQLLLQDHCFLSTDRAWANRHASRLMLLARHPQAALKYAVEALALASEPSEQLAALRAMRTAGGTIEASQAARAALQQYGSRLSAALLADFERIAADNPSPPLPSTQPHDE